MMDLYVYVIYLFFIFNKSVHQTNFYPLWDIVFRILR